MMSYASDSLRTDVLRDMHHNFDSLRLLFLYPDTARSLRSAFTHCTLTLRRSFTHRSCAVARPTYTARSSLLSPAHRVPHPHLAPYFGRALRRLLPLVACAAHQTKPRLVLVALAGGGARTCRWY
jgi:hypothetical protein